MKWNKYVPHLNMHDPCMGMFPLENEAYIFLGTIKGNLKYFEEENPHNEMK